MKEVVKKPICKNCEHYRPSYKSGYCSADGKNKKVKTQGTCGRWWPK